MSTTSNASATGGRGQARRPRHLPQRTCVGCRRTGDQSSFVRLVRQPEGVIVDEGRRREPGRGAYLCRDVRCWERGLRGAVAHALRTSIDEANRRALEAYGQQFAAGGSADATITHADVTGSDETAAPHAARTAKEEREV